MHSPQPGGVIAQLGERLNGIQEVGGSIPPGSTKFTLSTGALLQNPAVGQSRRRVITRGIPLVRIYAQPAACGAIAQLGERLNGIQEVGGSIPPGSTKFLPKEMAGCFSSSFRFVVRLLHRDPERVCISVLAMVQKPMARTVNQEALLFSRTSPCDPVAFDQNARTHASSDLCQSQEWEGSFRWCACRLHT